MAGGSPSPSGWLTRGLVSHSPTTRLTARRRPARADAERADPDTPDAQTERQGGAGPVRGLLGGKDAAGRFRRLGDQSSFTTCRIRVCLIGSPTTLRHGAWQ